MNTISTFKIEKNVAIPSSGSGRFSKRKATRYPFAQMEIMDSFAVPLSKKLGKHSHRPLSVDRLANSAHLYKKANPGWNYVTRVNYTDNNVRIWRVA